jgi:hypothetical protein
MKKTSKITAQKGTVKFISINWQKKFKVQSRGKIPAREGGKN